MEMEKCDERIEREPAEIAESYDEKNKIDVEILVSLIQRYPDGIAQQSLGEKYCEIKSKMNDPILVPISVALVKLKGSLIDYKTNKDGVRIFTAIQSERDALSIHPLIKEIGPHSPPLDCYPAAFLNNNAFVIHFQAEQEEAVKYDDSLDLHCRENPSELMCVEPWQVSMGDCFVYYCSLYKSWIRVKVVKLSDDEQAAACFAVDLDRYMTCLIEELRILPKYLQYPKKNNILRTSKVFRDHHYAVRCALDIASKPFEGFPTSVTGFRLALCGLRALESTGLKVRFLSYDTARDAFTVEVLSSDGNKSKLVEAVENNSDLLEVDEHFGMTLDGDDGDDEYLLSKTYEDNFDHLIAGFKRAFPGKKL